MSEPTLAAAKPTGQSIYYQPISLAAVIGLSCSSIFFVILLVNAAVGLIRWSPALLSHWLLLLPAFGVAASLLAQRRIRLSDGTLTGGNLALWGIVLGAGSGLGYFAYDFGTGWAVQSQARSFLLNIQDDAKWDSGFLAHLEKGNVIAAFLLTQPPNIRKGLNPNKKKDVFMRITGNPKDPKGPLASFKQLEMVYLLHYVKGDKDISLSVKNWKYEKGGFEVDFVCKIKTVEMTGYFFLKVRSITDNTPGATRKWFVAAERGRIGSMLIERSTKTELGDNLYELRSSSKEYSVNWCERMSFGREVSDHPRDETKWEDLGIPDKKLEKFIIDSVKLFFTGKSPLPGWQMRPDMTELVPWRDVNGHLQFTFTFFMPLPGARTKDTQWVALGELDVRSKTPVDPHKSAAIPDWRVTAFRIVNIRNIKTGADEAPGM